ncbi:MAG: phospholipid carrier-dependent glycosyltransferase [Streptosporangiales bacterium]|nr:phospholipid carrier-dependent glycosyltransferase [Streptosporangiales bacterium]
MFRRHWFFLAVLTAGALLRAVVQLAYVPAILYFDSHLYLDNADELDPSGLRLIGYEALLLRWLLPFHDLALIPAVQHLLGLGMGVAIYALLVRRGVRRWLSTLAAAPVLLDGYQLQIEQNVMSDTLFLTLVVAALVLMLWRPVPLWPAVAAAGVVLGLATTVRLAGLALVPVAVGYVAIVGRGSRHKVIGSGLVVLGFAAPLLLYGAWYQHVAGEFRLTGGPTKGKVLYGRTAPLADCGRLAAGDQPSYMALMCPDSPRYAELRREWYPRYWGPDYFANWGSPAHEIDYPPGVDKYDAMERFGWQVIKNQPLDVAGAVGRDFLKGFTPVRMDFPGDTPLERWRFQEKYPRFPRRDEYGTVEKYGGAGPRHRPMLAAFLRDYQSVAYTSGVVFAAGFLASGAAAVGAGRRARDSGLRAAALLVGLTGVSSLLLAALFEFSWRYQLPSVVLAPLAGALGLTALFCTRGSASRGHPAAEPAERHVGGRRDTGSH